jgi:lysophospholipase L1-like esterase
MHMDQWFEHWHRRVGDNEYLGIPYKLLIADISSEISADIDTYIADYIHFTADGAELVANAMVEKINQCPAGRWIFGESALKQEAKFPPNPHY